MSAEARDSGADEQAETFVRGIQGRGAAAVAKAQALQQEVGNLAGRIAETEDEVARVHDHISVSPNPVAAQAAVEARKARAFADHERAEQNRWK